MQQTVVEHLGRVAEDVVALTLRAAAGQLAPWDPGAHIDLCVPNWLVRQYSLCGDPADRDAYRVAVRYDPLSRGGSEYVHRSCAPAAYSTSPCPATTSRCCPRRGTSSSPAGSGSPRCCR